MTKVKKEHLSQSLILILLSMTQFTPATATAQDVSLKYSGYWNNTTFGSFGAVTMYVERSPSTFSLLMEPEGPVFGNLEGVPAIEIAGDLGDDGSAVLSVVGHPVFGNIAGTFMATGEVAISITEVPSDLVDSMELTGNISQTEIQLSYRINFATATPDPERVEGSDFALGQFTAGTDTGPMFGWIYPGASGDDYLSAAADGSTVVAAGGTLRARSGMSLRRFAGRP